jgi:hypothetical protein
LAGQAGDDCNSYEEKKEIAILEIYLSQLSNSYRMLIPDLKKIIQPNWEHQPGYGVDKDGWKKQKIAEQATTPEDPKILDKLGIKKGEKVLAIAGYYANWASFLAKKGAKVDYNDISKSMVKYVKKNVKVKFGKYVCSNYELIPKIEKEYDWTFTFEACGGSQGLPIAYLRSLLNKKGGILVLFYEKGGHMGSKWKRYPTIIKTLATIYHAKFEIKELDIIGHRKGRQTSSLPHRIYVLRTNDQSREMAKEDLKALRANKYSKDSLRRLSKVAKLIKPEFLMEL